MGEIHVLGSRDDENQFSPYTVHPKMFEENPVLSVGLGTNHSVVLAGSDTGKREVPVIDQKIVDLEVPDSPKPPKKGRKAGLGSKKDEAKSANVEEKKDEEDEEEAKEEDEVMKGSAPSEEVAKTGLKKMKLNDEKEEEIKEVNNNGNV